MDLVANYWTWLGLSAGLLFIIYKHLRKLFYPCVTLSELKDALGCLETVYKEHDLISALHDDEYYELKITASKIVEKHLLGPALWTYVGFHPRLMPEIVRWYERSEDVKRGILRAHEQDKQSLWEAIRCRRQAINQPSQAVPYSHSSAYESPFRSAIDSRAHTFAAATEGLLVITYKHLRKLFYPCVTLSELKDALGCLETVYKEHIDLVSALLDVDDEYYELKIAASKIVEEHLRGPALWTYVGFHPRLIPEIVRWYEQSEDVKRDILQAYEQDKQSRFEAERYRRQAIKQPSQVVPYNHSSSYESPFRSAIDSRARTFGAATEGVRFPSIGHLRSRLSMMN
ncbi:40S ribosomal protein S6 [Marasmius sp. AFHP31]|nr:40S ribosomal protein S6 [Marasmius sp. AFHP31]